MKFKVVALFCLIFGEIAFSQDTTVVLDTVALDTITLDTVALDTIVPVTLDTVTQDSAIALDSIDQIMPDTMAVDSSIKKGLHFFVSVGAQFINFNDRAKFQGFLDEQYAEYYEEYNPNEGYPIPQKQDFQKVNLAFPITAGVFWQFNDNHSLGLGGGFMYNNESVILTDKFGENYNFKYALQAFPVFAEYRLQISPDLLSLQNGDYFSVFLRYYWMLPGTEIYSSWGQAKSCFELAGNGYGAFLGYRFSEWEGFSFWGEMGYLSLDVKSKSENALLNSWNLGGISLLIRVTK